MSQHDRRHVPDARRPLFLWRPLRGRSGGRGRALFARRSRRSPAPRVLHRGHSAGGLCPGGRRGAAEPGGRWPALRSGERAPQRGCGGDHARQLDAAGPGRQGERRGLLSRRRGKAAPRRAGGWSQPRAGRGSGRAHLPRAPAVARERRRDAARPRPAPAWSGRPEGLRPRPVAAQRLGGGALPGLEPRLRHPLGQHLLHPLRRRTALAGDPGDAAARRSGPARRPDRQLQRGDGVREVLGHASRLEDRFQDRGRYQAREPADPPRTAARGTCERALGGLPRPRDERRSPAALLLERQHQDLGRRAAGDGPLAAGLAALVRPREGRSRERTAPSGEGRVVEGPGHGDPAARLEDPFGGAHDGAVVGGRRRRRLLLRPRARDRPRGRGLPQADRRRADDAALGLRPLAEPPALRDPAAEHRCRRRLPLAEDPVRHDRAGLVLLARERLGLAPVRQVALP